jgi:2-keto-3-deoxy-L-rhamnonate aldolase RhmA
LALELVEVAGYDGCLNGAAQLGLGQASAKQPGARALQSGIRHDNEVIDLAGRADGA